MCLYNKTSQEALCLEQNNGVLTRVHPEAGNIVGHTIIDILRKFSSTAREAIRVELPQTSVA